MAIAQVQTVHTSGPTTGPNTVVFSSPVSGNTLVVVLVNISSGSNTFATPSGWNLVRAETEAAAFWKISNGTETSTDFTYTGGVATRSWGVELSGAHASAPFDSSGYNAFAASTSVVTSTAASAAVNDEWAISMAGMNGTNGFNETASDSYTLLSTGVNDRDIAASRIYVGNGGGSVTTTLGWLTLRAGRWLIASFKPAGAAGPTPVPRVGPDRKPGN